MPHLFWSVLKKGIKLGCAQDAGKVMWCGLSWVVEISSWAREIMDEIVLHSCNLWKRMAVREYSSILMYIIRYHDKDLDKKYSEGVISVHPRSGIPREVVSDLGCTHQHWCGGQRWKKSSTLNSPVQFNLQHLMMAPRIWKGIGPCRFCETRVEDKLMSNLNKNFFWRVLCMWNVRIQLTLGHYRKLIEEKNSLYTVNLYCPPGLMLERGLFKIWQYRNKIHFCIWVMFLQSHMSLQYVQKWWNGEREKLGAEAH